MFQLRLTCVRLLTVASCLGGFASSSAAQCEIAKLSPPDGAPGDNFGNETSFFGNYAIIGAPYNDDVADRAGAVYFYEKQGSTWIEMSKVYASDAEEMDRFGWSVAIDDGVAAVGSRYDQALGYGTGAVYMYELVAGEWVETAKLLASDLQANTLFGHAVAVSGDVMVAGAHVDDELGISSGSAYVFEKGPGGWTQVKKLLASDGQIDDRFGFAVDIEGDHLVVGAYGSDIMGPQSGAAYVFERVAGVWTETTKLFANDGHDNMRYGSNVSIDNDLLAIGALNDNSNGFGSGSAYVYERAGGVWGPGTKLTPSDAEEGDFFGASVSIEGERVMVGAWSAGNGEFNGAGVAYLFTRENGVWNERTIYSPSDPDYNDNFGFSVALNGNVALVASRYDDEAGPNSGSVYAMPILETVRLSSTISSVSVAAGGSQELYMETCPVQAGKVYFVLGTFSGTSPGIALNGVMMPINFDFYTALTLGAPNMYPLGNSFGIMGPSGVTTTLFSLNPGTTPAGLIGTTVNHAAAILDGSTFEVLLTSAAVQIELLP